MLLQIEQYRENMLVDDVCEPFMAGNVPAYMTTLFGSGKGSGAALVMFILGVVGAGLCLVTGRLLKNFKYVES